MREIKVRVWDKINAQFTPINDIVFHSDGSIMQISTHFREHGDGQGDSDFEEIELIQYTGLKDWNEKEIYEGDIVKIMDESETFTDEETGELVSDNFKLTPVRFSDGAFWIDVDGIASDFSIHAVGWAMDYSIIEVVGNIYEHPELLEGESHV